MASVEELIDIFKVLLVIVSIYFSVMIYTTPQSANLDLTENWLKALFILGGFYLGAKKL